MGNIKNLVGPKKKHEHGNQFPDECKKYLAQIFHLIQLLGFFFLFQTGVRTISVFITQIIHTSVKVTRWNIQLVSNTTKNIVSQRSKTSGISQPLCRTACCHGQFLYTVCSLSH